MLEVMAGYDRSDPGSANVAVPQYAQMLDADLSGMRIGVARSFWEQADATAETVEALHDALRVFERLGATLVELKLPPLEDFTATCALILMAEAAAVHEENFKLYPNQYGEILRNRLYLGISTISAVDYLQALRRRRELCEAYDEATNMVDIVFAATTAGPAPLLDEIDWKWASIKTPLLTMPFNITGSPAIATRAGMTSTGLSLSFQLIGKHFDEVSILRAAHKYEASTERVGYRPPLSQHS